MIGEELMPKVFQTPQESSAAVEIVGVGLVPPFGKGGVVVEAAAALCPELQTLGSAPLTGKDLAEAAEAFAAARGLVVANVKDASAEALAKDAGRIPPLPDVDTVSIEEYDSNYVTDATRAADVEAQAAPAQAATPTKADSKEGDV